MSSLTACTCKSRGTFIIFCLRKTAPTPTLLSCSSSRKTRETQLGNIGACWGCGIWGFVKWARVGPLHRFRLRLVRSVEAPLFWNGPVLKRMNWSFPVGFLCSFTLGSAEVQSRVLLEFQFDWFRFLLLLATATANWIELDIRH